MKIQLELENLVIFESSLFRTTTTLIVEGDYILLIDPNWLPVEIDFIDRYISRIKGDRQAYLLFTHSDYDHIIGYGQFANYVTIATDHFITNPDKENILEQIRAFDDGYYIQRNYPIKYPLIDRVVATDGQEIMMGNEPLIFYKTPGHNRDGMVIYHPSQGVLIVGDYLSNIEFPYIYDSFKKYEQTLDKLETLINKNDIKILVTGHGDFTESKTEMVKRIQESRSYLQQLEISVRTDTPFNLEALFDRYLFTGIMSQFHEANIQLLKDGRPIV